MDHMLEMLSTELSTGEAVQLGKQLGISQNDIDFYLSQTEVPEKDRIFSLLKRWLKRQNSRQEAYNLMGQALVHPDVGLNLLATEILDFPSSAQPSTVHRNGKKLQNYQIQDLSQRLRRDDMYRLAPKLNISVETVDSAFAKYCTNISEAIKEILNSWLKRQKSRGDAYVKLGEGLIHPDVGLNLVAREVLGYPPLTKTFNESRDPNNVIASDINKTRNLNLAKKTVV